MKKIKWSLLLSIVLSLVFLTACQSKSAEEKIENYKTDYVGDASKVIHIAALQEYPEGVSYDHIEIQSEKEPYGLTVYLKISVDLDSLKEDLEENAQLFFDLIGNLGSLTFADAETGAEIATFTR